MSDPELTNPSRRTPWLRHGVAGGAVAALAVCVGVGLLFYPFVRDDYVLDGVVKAVALDDRDFGEERALERLAFEIETQGLADHVRVEDCLFDRVNGGLALTCRWQVQFIVPGVERSFAISFRSEATIDAAGSLD